MNTTLIGDNLLDALVVTSKLLHGQLKSKAMPSWQPSCPDQGWADSLQPSELFQAAQGVRDTYRAELFYAAQGTSWSCKAGILDSVKLDLPQGRKACHCGASLGISKMSCGQALVSPVIQQQGLARQCTAAAGPVAAITGWVFSLQELLTKYSTKMSVQG
ncbi:hypothetical protein A6R68_16245 [Neotoma lepida]|uniref:Uncharacterized protein n=1 Tax=Neotoma lepida TaxID=56216 RepID=A0A1A6HH85_NEOLE|nr:hypothetical protein A6R68_16245 [Neotoma lepida]